MTVVPVRTTNISRGGFLCLTNAPLELGTVLHARVQLSPHEALDCNAQVVRVSESAGAKAGEGLQVALRFVDLGEAGEGKLADALELLGDDVDHDGVPAAYRSKPAAP